MYSPNGAIVCIMCEQIHFLAVPEYNGESQRLQLDEDHSASARPSGLGFKRGHPVFWAAVFLAGAISFCSYHFILGNFFTGTDTLTLIESSQINSLVDAVSIFSKPLMSDSKFVEIGKFYRPVSVLSYSLDNALWGLDPFGFQLTNFLINVTVTCLVVIVMYQLSSGKLLFALLSGIMFAIHPALIECVPAIDRRHDMLVAVFLLASYSLYIQGQEEESLDRYKYLSLFFYGLALGSKEMAVIFPLILLSHIHFNSFEAPKPRSILSSIWQTRLYWMLTVAFIVWRTIVLEGVGGYQRDVPATLGEKFLHQINITYNYLIDLAYPADPLGILATGLANWWFFIILACLSLYILFFVRSLSVSEDCVNRRKSLHLLTCLGLWTTLPLLVFLVTFTFSHRSMYNSVIPFCGLVAYPLAETLTKLYRDISPKAIFRSSDQRKVIISRRAVSGLGVLMLVYLMCCSPMVCDYRQWTVSANIGRIILTKLLDSARDMPYDCKIHLFNLPDGVASYINRGIKAKEVTYLCDYSIKSWFRLCGFREKLEVIVHNRSRPLDFMGDLRLSTIRSNNSIFAIIDADIFAKRSKIVRTLQ